MLRRSFATGLTLLCVGCGTQGAPARTSSELVTAPVDDYRLGPGDELRIAVFGRSELTGQFPVSAQGIIAFPLIGDIPAAGKTLEELRAGLAERLSRGFVREPRVSVEVSRYRPFFILGEVENAGTYPYTPSLTVMTAVATAGGFTYRANSQRVFIQHAGEQNEREYPLTSTTPVQPGDTVRIPERRF